MVRRPIKSLNNKPMLVAIVLALVLVVAAVGAVATHRRKLAAEKLAVRTPAGALPLAPVAAPRDGGHWGMGSVRNPLVAVPPPRVTDGGHWGMGSVRNPLAATTRSPWELLARGGF